MNRYYLALDLIDDSGLIAEYEDLHKKVSPEIKKVFSTPGYRRWKFIDRKSSFHGHGNE